jgi:hypothetical protein
VQGFQQQRMLVSMRLHTEAIGHAIEILEQPDDVNRLDALRLAPACRQQRIPVAAGDLPGFAAEPMGEGQQRACRLVYGRAAIIARNGLDGRIVGAFQTEKLSVLGCSILAAIGAGDERRQHLLVGA